MPVSCSLCARVRAAQVGEERAARASSSIAGCGRFHVHAWGSPRDAGSREGGARTRAGGDAIGGSVDDAREGAGNFDGSVLHAETLRSLLPCRGGTRVRGQCCGS